MEPRTLNQTLLKKRRSTRNLLGSFDEMILSFTERKFQTKGDFGENKTKHTFFENVHVFRLILAA